MEHAQEGGEQGKGRTCRAQRRRGVSSGHTPHHPHLHLLLHLLVLHERLVLLHLLLELGVLHRRLHLLHLLHELQTRQAGEHAWPVSRHRGKGRVCTAACKREGCGWTGESLFGP
eukprot:352740-Chlamydomonas_euryale.AAC.3